MGLTRTVFSDYGRFCLVLLALCSAVTSFCQSPLPTMMQCRRITGLAALHSKSRLLGPRTRILLPTSHVAFDATLIRTRQDYSFRSSLCRNFRMQLFSSVSTVPQPASTAEDDEDERITLVEDTFEKTLNGVNGHADLDSIEAKLTAEGIRSRPKPGGTWNVEDPVGWAKDFGSRSPDNEARLRELTHLKPGDEGYFDVSDVKVPRVTMVRTREEARTVLDKLDQADTKQLHACDTEVMDIDLKSVGPVGNGYVTCVSVYSGPDFDFGLGDGPGTCLWIDNLDDSCGVLQEFKDWFQNPRHLKVWHNYGFDRHVMWNEGIDVQGFGGDTMHMARLEDTSRSRMGRGNGYSLESLTEELLKRRKKPMKEIFGLKRLRKDGSEGSLVDLPPVEVMQRDPKHRAKWIEYSCYDAQGTWLIHQELKKRLEKMPWYKGHNLYKYYMDHMRPFGEVLTDMERRGIRVDARDYLAKVELQAIEDRDYHSKVFREWAASKIGPDGLALNPASSVQLQTLLFGGAVNQKTREQTETIRTFKVPRDEIEEDALEAFRRRDEELEKKGKSSKSFKAYAHLACRADH